MLYYLSEQYDLFGPTVARLMDYLTVRSGLALLLSLFIAMAFGQKIIERLQKMQVGEISPAFRMTNAKGQTVCAIVKLKNRIDGHRANMTEDFQALKNVVVSKKREEKLEKWIQDKIASTYVRISPDWRGCDFKYKGWIK